MSMPAAKGGDAGRPAEAGAVSPSPTAGGGASTGRVKVVMPSNDQAIRDVQGRILDALDCNGFDAQCHFGVKLALEEALVNAVKHGNRRDPAKRVYVEYEVTPDRIEVCVEDEGPGFAREAVPDPTLEENIEKCSGRGLLLMEAYMTSVGWSQGGRRVRMVRMRHHEEIVGQ